MKVLLKACRHQFQGSLFMFRKDLYHVKTLMNPEPLVYDGYKMDHAHGAFNCEYGHVIDHAYAYANDGHGHGRDHDHDDYVYVRDRVIDDAHEQDYISSFI